MNIISALRNFRHLPTGILGWLLLHILLTSKSIASPVHRRIWILDLTLVAPADQIYIPHYIEETFAILFWKKHYTKWVFSYDTNYNSMQENKFCVVKDSNPTKTKPKKSDGT